MDNYEYVAGEEILPWGHSKSTFAQDSRVLIPHLVRPCLFSSTPPPKKRSFWLELTLSPRKINNEN